MHNGQKITRTASIRLNATFDVVFPLFGPVREMDWAHGWDPTIIYSKADNIEERMVFQTHAHIQDEEGPYTWTVSKYVPDAGQIEYTVFDLARIWWINIECQAIEAESICQAQITYTYIGLNPDGDERNKLALAAMFQHGLKDWELAINHFLETGSQLDHP